MPPMLGTLCSERVMEVGTWKQTPPCGLYFYCLMAITNYS